MPTPHEHLRAFEDEKLGEDCERHEGAVEKGSGSRFSEMSATDKARHAALEYLIEAEALVGRARAGLDAAIANHASAAARAGVEIEPEEPADEDEED
jgi:hypothetical protein